MSLPFELPPPNTDGTVPIWNGDVFQIGSEKANFLQYSSNLSGWNDELTIFHEETAGEEHFIDCASRQHTLSQLKKFLPHERATILEVGCSSGFMLKKIRDAFPNALVLGSDVVNDPLQKLSLTLPGIPLFQFDIVNCPLPDNCVDAIVILNVLEHIEQDSKAIAQIHRILKPGGVAIIEVPAGPQLYDIFDQTLMHYRRYTLAGLSALVSSHGFKIAKRSHLGFFLYPGFWLAKKRNKHFISESGNKKRQIVQNAIKGTGESKLMHAIMQAELYFGNYMQFPCGIRCVVTCKK